MIWDETWKLDENAKSVSVMLSPVVAGQKPHLVAENAQNAPIDCMTFVDNMLWQMMFNAAVKQSFICRLALRQEPALPVKRKTMSHLERHCALP